jgi:hypothetical protein
VEEVSANSEERPSPYVAKTENFGSSLLQGEDIRMCCRDAMNQSAKECCEQQLSQSMATIRASPSILHQKM